MRRKFIAAVTSGVLALTVMAALPTHAEAVSIWLDLTPGTESVETFQYKDYADRYSDAYELYGYDAEALFNHYETVGKAENRVGRFKKTPEEDDRHPYVWDADEPLDPLPPLDFHAQPDWFDARTLPENLSNVRIIKEYEQLEAFIEKDEWIGDPVLVRKEELLTEMSSRVRKCGIFICSALKIVLKVDLRPCIEVDQSFYIAFADNNAFAFVEVDVFAV